MHIRIMAFTMSLISVLSFIAPASLQPRLMQAHFAMLANPVAGFETNSLLVWRDGEIVQEAYFNGFDENTLHPVYSITRTVLKALVGIAIEQGYIQGIDQPVVDFFPEVDIAPGQESKLNMTVEHLLTKSSGVWAPWDDPVWYTTDDLGAALFALPLVSEPGVFQFQSGFRSATTELLSALLSRAIGGRTALEFAAEHLFAPLGITQVQWEENADGTSRGTVGLSLTPRDMLRFGLLYLNEGYFEGQQVLTAAWVAQSRPGPAENRRNYWDRDDYGYDFFTHEGTSFVTRAGGGQFIVIDPDNNTVIVRTGTFAYELGFFQFFIPLLPIYLPFILLFAAVVVAIVILLRRCVRKRRKRVFDEADIPDDMMEK